jgi:nucleoside-diphosphate-sugar epimerase
MFLKCKLMVFYLTFLWLFQLKINKIHEVMKVLFIGGTGNISKEASILAVKQGFELFHLNRGKAPIQIEGVQSLIADYHDKNQVMQVVKDHQFDVVVNFIAYKPEDVLRDVDVFHGKIRQYIFISSASVYQKPVTHPIITESTPLHNPYWQYSRDKLTCEDLLMLAYREKGFPVTIVRPSHTYDMVIPAALGSWTDFTLIDRMRQGKKVLIHGDGTSLWVMTHSIDFAKGFCGLLGNMQAIGHSFHITSDEVLTWNQIYQYMADAAGAELKAVHISSDTICDLAMKKELGDLRGFLHGDKSNSVIFDNTKIKRFVPGYTATIPFREGIRKTIEWYDADPSRKVINDHNNRLLDEIIGNVEND